MNARHSVIAALALLFSLVPSVDAAETGNIRDTALPTVAPPPPGPPGGFGFAMSVCETETCRLHSAVLALGSVLALSGAINLSLAAYIAYKARLCRSCGKTRSKYAARQAGAPLRCARCRRPFDVPFRWSWHACAWVHAAEQGPVLARPSVSVYGFPVSSAAAFHLTAVVAALDEPDAPAPQARAHEAMQLGPARPQAAVRAVAVDGDVETGGELDFYGQQTRHSTRDFFPPGAPVMLNPFFGAAA